MIPSLPLQDRRVLVPRGAKDAKSFSQLIERYGGIPVEIPLIAFRPVEMDDHLQKLIINVHTYDWIILTSKVAVETFLSFLKKEQMEKLPKIAVIGKKTDDALKAHGLKAAFYPSQYVAETFVEEFLPKVHQGVKVLIPKGNLARDYIAEALSRSGAVVDEAVVYENYLPDESREKLAQILAEKKLDILLFTSPSTFEHFMDVVKQYKLEQLIKDCFIGCIGPVTEKKIKSYGLPVHASPKVYTVEEMIKSMNAYLKEKQV